MPCPCRPICFVSNPACRPTESARARTLATAVNAIPLFDGVDAKVMQRLLADAHPMDVVRGSLLFTIGTEADCFYVALSCTVKLFALLRDGRESVIEIIRPVSSFGEAAMLSGSSFPVNAEIIEDGVLVRVGRRAFLSALQDDHQVAYRILTALNLWSLRLSAEAELLRGSQAWQRLADYLLTLAPAGNDGVTFRLPFSKEVLASRLGIRRESLSRVFGKLRAMGVETRGASVCIQDVAALRQAASSGVLPG